MTRQYERGGNTLRGLYLRWRQLHAFWDGLGEDGRISATKMFAAGTFFVLWYVAARSVSVSGAWTVALGCCFAVLFGRREFRAWMRSRNGNGHETPSAPSAPGRVVEEETK